jgi:hypothetical protein
MNEPYFKDSFALGDPVIRDPSGVVILFPCLGGMGHCASVQWRNLITGWMNEQMQAGLCDISGNPVNPPTSPALIIYNVKRQALCQRLADEDTIKKLSDQLAAARYSLRQIHRTAGDAI